MRNIWNAALTNEELVLKFKGILGDFFENYDFDYVGNYLNELQCTYYHHEFIRRAILLSMEKDGDAIEQLLKLVHVLNSKYNVHSEQV